MDYKKDIVLNKIQEKVQKQVEKIQNLTPEQLNQMIALTKDQMSQLKTLDQNARDAFLKKQPETLDQGVKNMDFVQQKLANWA